MMDYIVCDIRLCCEWTSPCAIAEGPKISTMVEVQYWNNVEEVDKPR
jgi:hypothetical protein